VGDVNLLRANWTYPNPIRFGAGRITELTAACREVGLARPLLVTDPGLAGLAVVKRTLGQLEQAGLPVAVFSDIRTNPTLAQAARGLEAYRDGDHDGIIAFGGGSALDAAKALLLMAGQEHPVEAFLCGREPPPVRRLPPLVAVPTTAGSGAVARHIAVLTDDATRRRIVLKHPGMMPASVICDPELTIGLPPSLTAVTGMNALSHNLEALCAGAHDPIADGIAVEGVRLARENLAQAFRNGSDLTARGHMMAAATLGGIAFRKGLGAIQALADPIGALWDTHHGLAAAVLTPYVLVHNRPAVEDKIARLAAYCGLEGASFDAFLGCVLALREELGIPHTLRGLGLGDERVEALVEEAAADPFAASNPVPLDAAAVRAIYARALTGDLECS